MVVNQFFTTGDFGQMQSGFRYSIQTTDMSYQTGRVETFTHQVQTFNHVVGVTTTGTNHVGVSIMHIVEVKHGAEVCAARTGEEVQTTVEGQDGIGLFNHGLNRSEAEYIVETFATADGFQFSHGIGHVTGVDVAQIDAT